MSGIEHGRRVALAILASLAVGACASKPTVAPPPAGAECVVLLHGLARTSGSMTTLADALSVAGYAVANIDYPSREQPIEALAPATVERGLAACRAAGATTIHFVTHSMGGLLVRQYLATRTLPELGRVVMLGTPNQGSEAVDRYGSAPGFEQLLGPAGAQLGTGPEGIARALGPVTYPVGVIAGTQSINPVISSAIPGPDDGKVAVERTRVEGMADFVVLPVAHPFLLTNEAAIRQTLSFLRSGRFERAAP